MELEEEMKTIKWDIIGLSEISRRGEDQSILKSEQAFHFIMHRNHTQNLI